MNNNTDNNNIDNNNNIRSPDNSFEDRLIDNPYLYYSHTNTEEDLQKILQESKDEYFENENIINL